MTKDWTGNQNSIYTPLGASNHTDKERESNDYYATEPKATELLCELETFAPTIWECACGEGHISEVLKERGYTVISSDLIDRGYGKGNVDSLKCTKQFDGDVVTNPPYKFAKEFVEHALEIITEGHKIAMFLKVQFLEGKARKELFEKYPPRTVYISSSRLLCALNGDFETNNSRAVAYAWFVWEKGFNGDTVVRWFN